VVHRHDSECSRITILLEWLAHRLMPGPARRGIDGSTVRFVGDDGTCPGGTQDRSSATDAHRATRIGVTTSRYRDGHDCGDWRTQHLDPSLPTSVGVIVPTLQVRIAGVRPDYPLRRVVLGPRRSAGNVWYTASCTRVRFPPASSPRLEACAPRSGLPARRTRRLRRPC